MTVTHIIRDLAHISTEWAIVAHQPAKTMRWNYHVPQLDLRTEVAHHLLETVQQRSPDGYVLLARVPPRA